MGLIDIILFLSHTARACIRRDSCSVTEQRRKRAFEPFHAGQGRRLLLRTMTRPRLGPVAKHSPDLLTAYQARSLLRAPQAGMWIGFHSSRVVRVRQVKEAVGERKELVDVHRVCRWVIRLPRQSRLPLVKEPR